LDVDRDYRSANCFEVDYRGWAGEQCGGARGWNPQWFVSQSAEAGSWTIELAIPLKEIVPHEIPAETVWGIRLSRLIGNDRDVWAANSTLPSSHHSTDRVGWQQGWAARPATFGLLEFK
jgi:hypothetical protein